MAVMGLPFAGIWLRLLRQVQGEPFRRAAHEERLQAARNSGRSHVGARPATPSMSLLPPFRPCGWSRNWPKATEARLPARCPTDLNLVREACGRDDSDQLSPINAARGSKLLRKSVSKGGIYVITRPQTSRVGLARPLWSPETGRLGSAPKCPAPRNWNSELGPSRRLFPQRLEQTGGQTRCHLFSRRYW